MFQGQAFGRGGGSGSSLFFPGRAWARRSSICHYIMRYELLSSVGTYAFMMPIQKFNIKSSYVGLPAYRGVEPDSISIVDLRGSRTRSNASPCRPLQMLFPPLPLLKLPMLKMQSGEYQSPPLPNPTGPAGPGRIVTEVLCPHIKTQKNADRASLKPGKATQKEGETKTD